MTELPESRSFRLTFLALCCLVVLPLWVCTYPPFTDLPQHAATVSVARHWFDPAYGYQKIYDFNWAASQVFTHALTWALAHVLPLMVAIKLVLSAAFIGIPIATKHLIRQHQGNPWWVMPVFPLVYGYSTVWGFYNFITATPLAIWLLTLCWQYAKAPSRRQAVIIALFAHGLFLTHILALAYAACIGACLMVLCCRPYLKAALGVAALASPLPLVTAWWLHAPRDPYPVPSKWGLGTHRFGELFDFQLSNVPDELDARGGAILLCLLPFLLGARPARQLYRWVPLLVTLAIFFLGPITIASTAFLYARAAVFLLPTLLFALDPRGEVRPLGKVLASAAPALILGLFTARYVAYEREVGDFHGVLSRLEAHRRVLYLPVVPVSQYAPGRVFMHFGAYYQAERGGVADFSFAELHPAYFRYKKETHPHLPGVEWFPERFRYLRDGTRYDYLVVRGPILRDWFSRMNLAEFNIMSAPGGWQVVRRDRAGK